jgi:hypothetical protein
VYRLNGSEWMRMEGTGERIAAGANGSAWVVNRSNEIFQWANGGFQRQPGTAMDVAANTGGQVWIIGTGQGAPGRLRRQRNP